MIYGKSDIGLVRDTNEDAFYFDDEINLAIIADGIGGHAQGEVASQTAIRVVREYINKNNHQQDKKKLLYNAFQEANQVVHQIQESLGENAISGTTLSAVIIDHGILYFSHIGDSRIYVSRNKTDIEQISLDHTYLSELARNDFKTFLSLQGEQLSKHHNYLTKAIGPELSIEPQIGSFKLKNNDYILLTTDGIHRYLNPSNLLQQLQNSDNINEYINSIIEQAIKMGGKDNITAIILLFNEGGDSK